MKLSELEYLKNEFKQTVERETDLVVIFEDDKILIGKYYNNEFEPIITSPKFGWRNRPVELWMNGIMAGIEMRSMK